MTTIRKIKQEADKYRRVLLNESHALNLGPIQQFQNSPYDGEIRWGQETDDPLPMEFGSINEFKFLSENRQYFLQMSDLALIRVRYVLEEGAIGQHSLAYYPCPFRLQGAEERELEEGRETLFDLIDEQWSKDDLLNRTRLYSPLRFDFDKNNSGERHPESHVHVCRNDCRVPVSAPIGIGRFMNFVLKHFYHDAWVECIKDVEEFAPLESLESRIRHEHRSPLHVRAEEN